MKQRQQEWPAQGTLTENFYAKRSSILLEPGHILPAYSSYSSEGHSPPNSPADPELFGPDLVLDPDFDCLRLGPVMGHSRALLEIFTWAFQAHFMNFGSWRHFGSS